VQHQDLNDPERGLLSGTMARDKEYYE